MKRSSVLSFFHSVVAVLVMTISATSAHADPNKGCELQSDYDAVLNGVAGLARSAKRAGMSEAAISQKRERLADLANEKYRACVVAETDLLVKAHEWVDLAPGKCAQKEDEAIAAVNALVKKQIQDPVTG